MNPASNSFCTSIAAAFLFSSPILLFFWAIGLASLHTESLWDITLGSMSGMSSAVQAKRSLLSARNLVTLWTSFSVMFLSNRVFCPSPVNCHSLTSLHGFILTSSLILGSRSVMTTILWATFLFAVVSVGVSFRLAM